MLGAGTFDNDRVAVKAEWGDRLVRLLLRIYPRLEGRIDLVDIYTPLSIEHYLGANKSEAAREPDTFSRRNRIVLPCI